MKKKSSHFIPVSYTHLDVYKRQTLDRDPYGAPCSPDNLKKSSGYWAESVSGDGQGETLEIKLRKPGRLLGIMLETGISPVTDPEKDSEARRHPNIAYSMFSRPKGIQVTLNGTYTFDATLRDDWTPQIVVPPYYRQPVHTIKIRINSIYRGTERCIRDSFTPSSWDMRRES